MSKRLALDELEAPASKRLQVESPRGVDLNDEQDDTTSQSGTTTAANAETAYTATTAVSTRSRKFPSDLKTIKCTYPDCNKTFNRPARLAAHLRSHTDDRPFKCPHDGCDKSYREEKHLRQHVKGSHTQERAYTCTFEGCGKSFLTATRLRRHQDVHAGQERFRCRDYPPCDQTFRKHNTLQRHIRAEHLGGPAFVCPEEDCGLGFESQGALRNHRKREHSEIKFWCEECTVDDEEGGEPKQVGFTSLTQLRTHVKKEHLSCIFCDQKCRGQSELEKHVEIHHSGNPVDSRKTIACPWEGCDKKFTKKNNLNAHIRSAHQGFRFVCGEVDFAGVPDLEGWSSAHGCGSGFVTKATLEQHIRHVHMGVERPLPRAPLVGPNNKTIIDEIAGTRRNIPCTVPGCHERFIRHHDLQEHLENHPEMAPPACPPVESSSHQTPPSSIEAEVLRLAEEPAPYPRGDGDTSPRDLPDLPFFGMFQDVAYRDTSGQQDSSPGVLPFPNGLEDVFWIGADGNTFPVDDSLQQAQQQQENDAMWRQEEADMRLVIDDEEFNRLIDPALGGFNRE